MHSLPNLWHSPRNVQMPTGIPDIISHSCRGSSPTGCLCRPSHYSARLPPRQQLSHHPPARHRPPPVRHPPTHPSMSPAQRAAPRQPRARLEPARSPDAACSVRKKKIHELQISVFHIGLVYVRFESQTEYRALDLTVIPIGRILGPYRGRSL